MKPRAACTDTEARGDRAGEATLWTPNVEWVNGKVRGLLLEQALLPVTSYSKSTALETVHLQAAVDVVVWRAKRVFGDVNLAPRQTSMTPRQQPILGGGGLST